MTTLANDDRLFFFKAPTIRCPGGVRISADSARVYEATQYNQLWGNVVFRDEASRLTADQAQYFANQRRLVAQGNTVLTDLENGSVIRGDNLTLIRAGPDQPEDFLNVTGRRPHATLYPARPTAEVDSVEAVEVEPDTLGVSAPADTTVGMALSPDSGGVARLLPDSSGVGLQPPDSLGPGGVASDSGGVARLSPDSALVALEPPDSVRPVAARPDSGGVARMAPDSGAVAVQPEVQTAPAPPAPVAEADRVPYEIDAQRFLLQGSRFFRAAGSVVVTRDSLRAVADSLEYDKELGALFLSQDASVTSARTDLAAKSIRLDIPQDEVREAQAEGDAVLEGEDLTLLAPHVTLFFTEGRMERLAASRDAEADSAFAEMDDAARERERLRRGAPPLRARELGFSEFPRRPYALAQDFILEGDSLEVSAPEEILQEVRAMGQARGEASGRDTLNTEDTPELIRRDWLEGDTIVAIFRPAADSVEGAEGPSVEGAEGPPLEGRVENLEADSAGPNYQLEELVARGRARSMYRMAPSDSVVAEEPGRVAIHYVVGDEITITLNSEGEAERMEVKGQTRGIHLEPIRGAGVKKDTLSVPDTSQVLGPIPLWSRIR